MKKLEGGDANASILARLRRNMGVLLSGGAATTLLGVLTLALNARALDPALLGVLALVQSYVIIVGRIFSFDTWQGLIRFGADAEARGDTARLRAIVNFAILFDAGSALAAGTVGLALLFLFRGLTDFPPDYIQAAAVYTASLFFQLAGAPIGIMRLFNKFQWQTGIAVGEGAAKLAAAAILFALEAPVTAYIYAYGGILVAAGLVRIAVSLRLLAAATGRLAFSRRDELSAIARQFVTFSAGSWITGTLNVTRRDGTTLVVAALLGPAGAGYYAVAQRIVTPIRDVADMLRQALFPDLSRLVAQEQHDKVAALLKRVLLYTMPLALLTLLGTTILGELAIWIIAGPGYERAYWILVALGTACCLYLCMPALSSLVILYAGMRIYTLAAVAAAAVWALLFTLPMLRWGIDGAAVGEVIFLTTWLAINTRIFLSAFRRRREAASLG